MAIGKSGITPMEEGQGAIYVANFYGRTIAQGGDGSYQNPVTLMSEAAQLADAQQIRKIVLLDPYDNQINLDADLNGVGYIIEGAAENRGLVSFNPNGHRIGYCVFRNLSINGNFDNNDQPTEFHNCQINSTMTDVDAYLYNCLIFDIGMVGGNTDLYCFNCYADRETQALITGAAGAELHMVNFKGFLSLTSFTDGWHEFEACEGLIVLDAFCTGGATLVFTGNVKIDQNVATCVIVDYTGRPKSEAAVNITAILASETNVVNQVADPDYPQQYILENLTLKSVDPGANNVNVKLYQLVNGALVNTKMFAITTANFGTYWDLVSLFGLPEIHGDQIKITVQATGGGPYAVTGSYTMRHY